MAVSRSYVNTQCQKARQCINLCACNSDSLNTAVLVDMETKVTTPTLSGQLLSLKVTEECCIIVWQLFTLILDCEQNFNHNILHNGLWHMQLGSVGFVLLEHTYASKGSVWIIGIQVEIVEQKHYLLSGEWIIKAHTYSTLLIRFHTNYFAKCILSRADDLIYKPCNGRARVVQYNKSLYPSVGSKHNNASHTKSSHSQHGP